MIKQTNVCLTIHRAPAGKSESSGTVEQTKSCHGHFDWLHLGKNLKTQTILEVKTKFDDIITVRREILLK